MAIDLPSTALTADYLPQIHSMRRAHMGSICDAIRAGIPAAQAAVISSRQPAAAIDQPSPGGTSKSMPTTSRAAAKDATVPTTIAAHKDDFTLKCKVGHL